MVNTAIRVILCLIVALLVAPAQAIEPEDALDIPEATVQETRDVEKLVESLNAFTLDLLKQYRGSSGNVVVSPSGLTSTLAAVANSARRYTADEIEAALHLPSSIDHHTRAFQLLERRQGLESWQNVGKWRSANGIWIQRGAGYHDGIVATARNCFDVDFLYTNFAASTEDASKDIQRWTRKRTWYFLGDFITENRINNQTRMISAQAMLWQGKWASAFLEDSTYKTRFYRADGNVSVVEMMSQTEPLFYRSGSIMQSLELPYVGRQASLILIMPHQAGNLWRIEKELTPEYFKRWTGELQCRLVNARIPKIDLITMTELSGVLDGVGVKRALRGGRADLSPLDGGSGLYVESVVQKVRLQFKEEGLDPAQARAERSYDSSWSIPSFTANHPFLFFIRDNVTGRLLFAGRIANL